MKDSLSLLKLYRKKRPAAQRPPENRESFKEPSKEPERTMKEQKKEVLENEKELLNKYQRNSSKISSFLHFFQFYLMATGGSKLTEESLSVTLIDHQIT